MKSNKLTIVKRTIKLGFLAGLVFTACIACVQGKDFDSAYNDINQDYMRDFVREIGSDKYQGRMPGSSIEPAVLDFLSNSLQESGFVPAFEKGFLQEVPLVKITSSSEPVKIAFTGKKKNLSALKFEVPTDIAAFSQRPVEKVDLENIPMVFCGFGAVAPEYNWNDFEEADIEGKIAIVFVNDPGLYTGESLFKGRELTIYGRWKYKFEEAARQGAAGILVIHDDLGAGYNWQVASRGAKTGTMFIDDPSLMQRCPLVGWIQQDAARKIFENLGYNLEEMRTAATQPGFKAIPLEANLSVTIHNSMEKSVSCNVAGILPGSDPELSGESVVLVAHWDHFGKVPASMGTPVEGGIDSIYNGAVDNGVAMAWAMEIGRAVSALKKRPARSLVILFPTAEEQGLLGSEFYVRNPAIPMEKTRLCLGIDMLQPRGRMKDLMLIGYGYTPVLDSLFANAAKTQGRYITPDPNAHTGLFFRSDHYPFYAKGVPAMWAMGCYDSFDKGKEWAARSWQEFLDTVYHTPMDNFHEDWDWSGVVDEARIGFTVAHQVLESGLTI